MSTIPQPPVTLLSHQKPLSLAQSTAIARSASSTITPPPYTPQQLLLASQSLSSPLSILLLLDYLDQTGDVMGLVHGYGIMSKLRMLLEASLRRQQEMQKAVSLKDPANGNSTPSALSPSKQLSPMVTEENGSLQQLGELDAMQQKQHFSVAASLGYSPPQRLQRQSNDSLLNHLYMLLKSLLSYRHGDVCNAFFEGEPVTAKRKRSAKRRTDTTTNTNSSESVSKDPSHLSPENTISLFLADSNVERRTIALEIVSMLLESNLVNVKEWCTEEFCVELLGLVSKRDVRSDTKESENPTSPHTQSPLPHHGLHRAIIEVLSALLRRELLTPRANFSWLQGLLRNHWYLFEALFSEISAQAQANANPTPSFFYMDEDSFLVASSFLEMLSFQVPLDWDSKKEVQKLNDALKISRWNLSRREQRKIQDQGQHDMKNTKQRESEIYSTYGELLHSNAKQEEMISSLRQNLTEQKSELRSVRSIEEKSQKTFLVGVVLSVGLIGAFYCFKRFSEGKHGE
mmetsp:Transcript_6705/g.25118  ORF Transcript_6705/g.25118 Transcript_6705/m.25118 type:complete len:515 (-) Transcript_6705:2206-3750(-)|eukprot:CAMPEP_0117441310 /NCGR_PEP_ID=MMETSP0759-20121206/3569_1 /TAXON_ID=63605 /ORGANISM="Percolomonas cosmopolitus, Strain WS" /LENGTH=514 /DNA_ID=CAMNT_0005233161 /DNA_START=425 /DNA_END=1969 /DNA_ORIENTATION=-